MKGLFICSGRDNFKHVITAADCSVFHPVSETRIESTRSHPVHSCTHSWQHALTPPASPALTDGNTLSSRQPLLHTHSCCRPQPPPDVSLPACQAVAHHEYAWRVSQGTTLKRAIVCSAVPRPGGVAKHTHPGSFLLNTPAGPRPYRRGRRVQSTWG